MVKKINIISSMLARLELAIFLLKVKGMIFSIKELLYSLAKISVRFLRNIIFCLLKYLKNFAIHSLNSAKLVINIALS